MATKQKREVDGIRLLKLSQQLRRREEPPPVEVGKRNHL